MSLLDPAAPHGGELPVRPDVSYFVCHPCHPPIVNDETDPEQHEGCGPHEGAASGFAAAILPYRARTALRISSFFKVVPPGGAPPTRPGV